jgi:hypothetical protein
MTNIGRDHWELPPDYTSTSRDKETISTLLAQLERLEARLIEVEQLAANLAAQLKRQHNV